MGYNRDSEEISTETTHLLRRPDTFKTEVTWILKNGIPAMFCFLMQNSLQVASVFTLGHLSPTDLAAAALASMFAGVTGWSTTFGAATALDTLCSQSFTGASNRTATGVHFQRGLAIIGCMFIPIACIWWNSTKIFLAFNQEPELAEKAGLFLRYLLIGAPAFIAFEATKKFLQAQGIMQASPCVLIFVSPINLALNYTLVHLKPFQLGFKGAPIATSCSYWLMLALLICYIRFVKGKEGWGGWTREALTDWWPFLKLAIPSLFMVTAEWWVFELAALAASYMSTNDLAAQSILMTAATTVYAIPFGLSVAASNRVGNSLGEGNGRKAHLASIAILLFALGFGFINTTVLMTTRHKFGYIFSPDEDIVAIVAHIMPFCAASQVGDALATACGGAIRGMGRQTFAAWVSLLGYYLVGVPLGYFLAFHVNLGLSGIWLGLISAASIVTVSELIYLALTDWNREVSRAKERVYSEQQQQDEEY